MNLSKILAELDAEIKRLRQAREILQESEKTAGSPKKKPILATKKASSKTVKRNLSPEGRKRIADAQRKRWNAAKKGKPKDGGTGDGGYGFTKTGDK